MQVVVLAVLWLALSLAMPRPSSVSWTALVPGSLLFGAGVSSDYKPKFPLTGGRIVKVVYDVGEDAYVDLERHLNAAMARD